jgi:hypothetical protein
VSRYADPRRAGVRGPDEGVELVHVSLSGIVVGIGTGVPPQTGIGRARLPSTPANLLDVSAQAA